MSALQILDIVKKLEKSKYECEAGELEIRGPHLMRGYLENPEETKQTFREDWLKTGDLASRIANAGDDRHG